MTRQEIINLVSALVLFLCFCVVLITFLVRALGAQGFVILVVGVCMGLALGLGAWGAWDRHKQDKEMDERRLAHHEAQQRESEREWAELHENLS